jgi:predicted Zn-dependent protease
VRQGWRPSQTRLVLIAAAVLLIGPGIYIAGWGLWAEYHFAAAQRAVERRAFAQAQQHFAAYLDVRPRSAEGHFLAGRTARRAGAADAATTHLDQAQELGWVPQAIDLERALLLAQRGDLARVERNLLIAIHHNHADTLLILEALVQGYLRTYRLSDALQYLDLWLEREPNNVQAHLWRGQVKERRNSLGEAVAAYRRAVELEPANDSARLALAQALVRSDQVEAAVEHFESLHQRQPENPEVLLGLAACRRGVGKTEEARQQLDALLAAHPRHVAALIERGKLALQTGQPAEAEDWLRKAVALAPFDRDASYNLYQCLIQRGRREEAQQLLTKVEKMEADFQQLADVTKRISASPNDPALRHEAGVILLRNGQDQEGLRWLVSALQEAPNHRETHQTLVEYYERTGQSSLAAQHRQALAPVGN